MEKKVVIFTTPTCTYCKMTKEFFREHNINYEERDVTKDEKAKSEMIEKSGQMGVPVIMIDEEFIVGFDKNRLSKLLDIS